MMAIKLTSFRGFFDSDYPAVVELDERGRNLRDQFNLDIQSGDLKLEEGLCLCGLEDFGVLAEFDRYRIRLRTVICRRCGLIQSMPRMTEAATASFYASDTYRILYGPELLEMTPAIFDAKAASFAPRYDFISKVIGREPRSVLEIGCGGGWNLWPYHELGVPSVGYDLGPTLVAYGRSRGLDLREGGIGSIDVAPTELIILSHVIEHFLDPVTDVARIASHLRDDGMAYIEVPNAEAFCVGGLQNAHNFYFSPRTLRAYLAAAGLTVIEQKNFTSHMGVVAQKSAGEAKENLRSEFAERMAQIKRHDRRERFKDALDRFHILGLARRILKTT